MLIYRRYCRKLRKIYSYRPSCARGKFASCTVEKRTALLLGNESHGLPETLLKMVDEQWSIPGSSKADSLSLPQAAAIMMYECVKKVSIIDTALSYPGTCGESGYQIILRRFRLSHMLAMARNGNWNKMKSYIQVINHNGN